MKIAIACPIASCLSVMFNSEVPIRHTPAVSAPLRLRIEVAFSIVVDPISMCNDSDTLHLAF